MPVPQPAAAERGEHILAVFDTAFGELLAADPAAFRVKFRKMAGSAFAFYRGTACLFYADLEGEARGGPYLDGRTGRVWIHGDLHAENFGTYMDANGRLIFNVNDFDEAYVGPFTWDLKRLAASLALIGYAKALSDGQITELVRICAAAYRERIGVLAAGAEADEVPGFTLETADGPLLDALRTARSLTRFGLLDSMTEIRDFERRFSAGGGAIALDAATRREVLTAFDAYLGTLPESSLARPDSYRVKDVVGRRGIGIGSAGLPSYNILLEGNSDALENDVVIYLKQAQTPAVSRHVTDAAVRDYFRHEGHRTVISQRALQAHADPWLGWTELGGAGQLVAEVSPYAVDLDWSDIDDPAEIAATVADLGRATATMHAAADDSSGHSLVPFSTERAIDAAIGADGEGFAELLVDFAHAYGARARADHQIFVDLFRNGRIPGLRGPGETSTASL
ncbi:hypothetical protein GCM10010497_30850 [Streptomyces cinereoruber]|uniref:DUF2252 domain-containing protein n=1 Tax=Streptomyces cinereoruber TaxID=67260 RepID=A0AAV4KHN0_9ACTN|nr:MULTISPECIES: DUF2252 domain-containing protein [Streptomyces]MBB4155823.1 uncharacterized protein (DUF2252 family) [Streptomyces cinereoruber]MBY8817059.1 DUF2252 domain-containing protein [Streptomyces cinereoruber]NIH64634.1 uncharacterized protein (DUF2252 family) [Streptomyces cinereoruber]PVC71686.1 DUF2252 domain-containing protein [Streptomyces sp. CS081A]QEV32330.1 DUF2252 domain-containing protein [Streptomyces cinereoruber]